MVPLLDRRAARLVPARTGCAESHLRVREHGPEELSHYSQRHERHRVRVPDRLVGARGVANRGDYDLTQHAEHSGTTLEWVGPEGSERYVPYVIEPAGGDRADLRSRFLVDAYDEEEVAGRERTVLRLHPRSRR